MASMVVGGSQFESMLCHWKIWWRAIPSTKPPKPMPSRMPAVVALVRWSGVCIRPSPAVFQLLLDRVPPLFSEWVGRRKADDRSQKHSEEQKTYSNGPEQCHRL